MKKYVILIFCFVLGTSGFAQFAEKKFSTKEIRVRNDNQVIIASILIGKHKETTKRLEKEYLWYDNNEIKTTKGDYFGKLLHGEFRIFDKNNNIISSGVIHIGLKEGQWIEWHDNGNYKHIGHWHKGQQHGKWKNYAYDGSLTSTIIYKNGIEKRRVDAITNDESDKKRKKNQVKNQRKKDLQMDSVSMDSTVQQSGKRKWFGFLKRTSTDSTEVNINKDSEDDDGQKKDRNRKSNRSETPKESKNKSASTKEEATNSKDKKRRVRRSPPSESINNDATPNE